MGRISTWALIGIFTATTGCGSGLIMTDVHSPSDEALAAASDWNELKRLSPGATVLVEVDGSDAVRGKIATVSDVALTLTGHAAIPRGSVVRVSRVESLSRLRTRKGAAIGFGIGVLTVIALGGVYLPPLVGYPLFGAGIGASSAIGVTRQTVIYQRR